MIAARGAIAAVFFLLELGALAAFGYWGFHLSKGWIVKIAVGLGAPLLAAVFWGTFVAPKAAFPVALPVRAVLQLLVFGLASAALYASGHTRLAAGFLAVSIVEVALNDAMDRAA
ncbi:YrdB family protein [Paenibacillus sp. GYB003]|uniref:YrdB family protein n=1 Tax=Paenibacillus sp. GYB003 TaxID=2994392 RepID=UPI002F96B45C